MSEFTLIAYHSTAGFTWWNLLPSGFGAIIGAGASMIPSFILARHSRKQNQKTATRRGMVKLQMIVNGSETLHRAIEESISELEKALGQNAPLWQKVFPLAGNAASESRFDAEEVAIFLTDKNTSYGNNLLLAGERYASLQHACTEYSSRRIVFTDLIASQLASYPGGLPASIKSANDLRAKELNSLAEQIRSTAKADYESLLDLAEKFGEIARQLFNDTKFPKLDVAEARKQHADRHAAK